MTTRSSWSMRIAVTLLFVASWGPGLAAEHPPAQIAVSPSRFDLDLDAASGTHALNVFNFGDEPVRIATSVVHWDLDERNEVRIIEPDEQSLDQSMVINPLRFTVEPGRSQTVRFAIRPRADPEPGEHRAMIYFDQTLPADRGPKLRVKFRLGVAVYAHVGELRRDASLASIDVVGRSNPVRASLDILNLGSSNVRMVGRFAIRRADRAIGPEDLPLSAGSDAGAEPPDGVLLAGRLPSRPVLPSTRREILLETSRVLPPGDYVLDLRGELGGDPIDHIVPFAIPHPAQVRAPPPD